jgi:hypothetical protein
VGFVSACDLGYEVVRPPQGHEGLLECLSCLLRLAPIALEALVCFEAAPESGFTLLFGVSFRGDHQDLLCTVWIVARRCEDNHIPPE